MVVVSQYLCTWSVSPFGFSCHSPVGGYLDRVRAYLDSFGHISHETLYSPMIPRGTILMRTLSQMTPRLLTTDHDEELVLDALCILPRTKFLEPTLVDLGPGRQCEWHCHVRGGYGSRPFRGLSGRDYGSKLDSNVLAGQPAIICGTFPPCTKRGGAIACARIYRWRGTESVCYRHHGTYHATKSSFKDPTRSTRSTISISDYSRKRYGPRTCTPSWRFVPARDHVNISTLPGTLRWLHHSHCELISGFHLMNCARVMPNLVSITPQLSPEATV